MTSDWISAISAFAQVLIGIGTFVLSYVLWKSADQRSKLDYMRGIQQDWIGLNSLILSNPELAEISDSVFFGNKLPTQNKDERLKRYMQYKILNIIESEYMGRCAGLVSDDYHNAISNVILQSMLTDKDLIEIIKTSGFHNEFIAHCEQLVKSAIKEVEQCHPADPE